MRNFLMFIQWQWREFEFWQKCFIVVVPAIVASVFLPKPYDQYLYLAAMSVVFAFFTKWIVWDGIKASYAKYRKQRDNLFNEIRGD